MSGVTRAERHPESLDERIDQVCSPFEAACQAALAGGPWPELESFLGECAEPERGQILQELILLDIHYRERAGRALEADAYRQQFPDLDPAWVAEAMAATGVQAANESGNAKKSSAQKPTPEMAGALLAFVDRGNDRESVEIPRQLGEHRILREVGRGGMGVVYEAVQESLGRHVALKVLPFANLLEPTHLERFHREAQAAAQLHHTNIVPVFGVGEDRGLHFYAMQFIEGRGLDRVLQEVRRLRSMQGGVAPDKSGMAAHVAQSLVSGNFRQCKDRQMGISPDGATRVAAAPAEVVPEQQRSDRQEMPASSGHTELGGRSNMQYFRAVARVGLQVAEALDYAHRQGVLHRDIKPSNLLLDRDGTVWVTDFGLAKAESGGDLTQPGDIVGTLRYMAPERFEGRSDPRSDVYSFGLTLYELVTLKPAFEDANRLGLIERVHKEAPPAPRTIDPHVPRDLETVVLKAIAREPKDRYTSAGALAEDLRRFLADRPVRARRTPLVERTWRWCRRNPWIAGLTGVAALLLVIIAAGASVTTVILGTQLTRTANAEHAATEKLWDSYLEFARAQRQTTEAERRFRSLEALTKAADIRSDLRLRNEIIACLPLVDLHTVQRWELDRPLSYAPGFDHRLDRYAYGDLQGNVSIRRLDNNEEILHLSDVGKSPFYANPVFSPDGRFLAVPYSGRGDFCRVWDLREGKEAIPKVPIRNGSGCRDFSPDSRRLALRRPDGSIVVIDLITGQENSLPKVVIPDQIVFHPEGRQLALSSLEGQAVIVDLEKAEIVDRFPHEAAPRGIAWSHDGRYLAVGCDDCKIYVYNAYHQLVSVLEGHFAPITHLMFSSSGLLASTGWDATTRLWDPLSGRLLVTALGHGIRFSKDGRHLAFNYHNRHVGLWDVSDGRECRTLHHGEIGNRTPSGTFGGRCNVAFSPDGQLLASTGTDGVRLWRVGTGQEVAHLSVGSGQTAVFHPQGTSLITYSRNGQRRWPIQPALDPKLVEKVPPEVLRIGPPRNLDLPRGPDWRRACWSHDGSRVAAVDDRNRRVLVLDPDKPTERMVLAHPSVSAVALSSDGRWAATAAGSGRAKGVWIWDAQSGALKQKLPSSRPENEEMQVAFSPDSQWFVMAGQFEFRLWRVDTWEEERVFPNDTMTTGPSLAFSRHSPVLAMAVSAHRIQLVDLEKMKEIASLSAPDPQAITSLCFSPDGSLLAAGTLKQEIQIWDLRRIRQHLAQMGQDWDFPIYGEKNEKVAPAERWDVQLDARLLDERAFYWLNRGDYANAIADLRACLEIDPESARTSNFLAFLYVTAPPELRDPNTALRLVQNALRQRPDDHIYLNTLGVVHYRRGEYERSAEILARIAPQDKEVLAVTNWLFLAMSYHHLKENTKARDCYFRAVTLLRDMKLHKRDADELNGFRVEAGKLLGEGDKR